MIAETVVDLDIAARTVMGEARGEPTEGKKAVAWVIKNRSLKGGWWGNRLETVCKLPWQFSCWNKNDPNRDVIEKMPVLDKTYLESLRVVIDVLLSDMDPTCGSTHYYNPALAEPVWARGKEPIAKIGKHVFFNDI